MVERTSLVNYDNNSNIIIDTIMLDDCFGDFVDFDNLELPSDSSSQEANEYKSHQDIDTMHSILLTPTISMRYVEFEKDNSSFLQMGLLKYPGDYHHSIRYFATTHLKYIVYTMFKNVFLF